MCEILCEKVVIFTQYSYGFHTYFTRKFHMHVKISMWKACENSCETCYPFHTVFSHVFQMSSLSKPCEKTMWKVTFSHIVHMVVTHTSHNNFTYWGNIFLCEGMWKECEQHVKICSLFHIVFHMLCRIHFMYISCASLKYNIFTE